MRPFSASWVALPLTLVALVSVACGDGGGGGNNMTATMGGSAPVAGSGGSASGDGGSAITAGSGGTVAGAGTAGGGAGGAGGGAGMAGSGGSGGMAAVGCAVPAGTDDPPMMLSQTNCINMADHGKPAPGLIPYSVRSPLWSDGASKERFMSIPSGQKIHAFDCAVDADLCKDPGLGGNGEDEGHFDMPVGAVLVKNFSIENKIIETRLLMRRSMTSWAGFSYEWNDAQSEATLLPDNDTGKDKPVGSGTQVWHYPSRSQCLLCHTKYAGRSLGPSTAQLNSDYAYADGTMNQVEKLKQLGVFDAPPKDIKGYPVPADMAGGTLDERARSYMQANCAMCHRPGGEFAGLDMRIQTALIDTKLCEKPERDSNLVPPWRLAPGKPADSGMSFRMHALDMLRMPKVGSKVVDDAGTKLIDDWITSLQASACPNQ